MAGENQNTGPNLGGSGTADSAKKYLKQLLEDQGDYNNLLKSFYYPNKYLMLL